SRRRCKKVPVKMVSAWAETGCCDVPKSHRDPEMEPKRNVKATSVDIEKVAGRSHVLLNVAGMDCSGCVNNLTRALQAVTGTENVKVIFITGTAEFDLDTDVNALDNVIRSAQQATGYKLTPFSSDTQNIDVTMGEAEASKFRNNLPRGVERCEKLSKTTY